jgi:hypothetical protein
VPNAGRTGKADRARPERHDVSAYHVRFIFAYGSADVAVPADGMRRKPAG